MLHCVCGGGITTYCAAPCVWRGSYHVLCCTVCVEGELPGGSYHVMCCTVCVEGELPCTVLHRVWRGGYPVVCCAPCVCVWGGGGYPVLCCTVCVGSYPVGLLCCTCVWGGGGRLPRTLLHRAADVAQLHDVHTQTTLVFEVQCHPHWTVPPRLLDTLSVYLVLAATSTDNPDILGQTVGHTL